MSTRLKLAIAILVTSSALGAWSIASAYCGPCMSGSPICAPLDPKCHKLATSLAVMTSTPNPSGWIDSGGKCGTKYFIIACGKPLASQACT